MQTSKTLWACDRCYYSVVVEGNQKPSLWATCIIHVDMDIKVYSGTQSFLVCPQCIGRKLKEEKPKVLKTMFRWLFQQPLKKVQRQDLAQLLPEKKLGSPTLDQLPLRESKSPLKKE